MVGINGQLPSHWAYSAPTNLPPVATVQGLDMAGFSTPAAFSTMGGFSGPSFLERSFSSPFDSFNAGFMTPSFGTMDNFMQPAVPQGFFGPTALNAGDPLLSMTGAPGGPLNDPLFSSGLGGFGAAQNNATAATAPPSSPNTNVNMVFAGLLMMLLQYASSRPQAGTPAAGNPPPPVTGLPNTPPAGVPGTPPVGVPGVPGAGGVFGGAPAGPSIRQEIIRQLQDPNSRVADILNKYGEVVDENGNVDQDEAREQGFTDSDHAIAYALQIASGFSKDQLGTAEGQAALLYELQNVTTDSGMNAAFVGAGSILRENGNQTYVRGRVNNVLGTLGIGGRVSNENDNSQVAKGFAFVQAVNTGGVGLAMARRVYNNDTKDDFDYLTGSGRQVFQNAILGALRGNGNTLTSIIQENEDDDD